MSLEEISGHKLTHSNPRVWLVHPKMSLLLDRGYDGAEGRQEDSTDEEEDALH
jgi:hypothetical protein